MKMQHAKNIDAACYVNTGLSGVFLQSKNQPIIKLFPSLLATQLRSNASTQCLFHPAPTFRFVTSWDLGFCFSLTCALALQEHRQAHSDSILVSEKSKFFQNVDCFHLILDAFAHQYCQYLEYIDNSTTLAQKI